MNVSPPLAWSYYLSVALSLWLGWGIRGNYGHEYGAMIPGARGPGGCPDVGPARLAPAGRGVRLPGCAGLVVRRQHLVHAGGRLYALGPVWRACSMASRACSSSASSGRRPAVRGRRSPRSHLGGSSPTWFFRPRWSLSLWWLQGIVDRTLAAVAWGGAVLVRHRLAGRRAGDRGRAGDGGDPLAGGRRHRVGAQHGGGLVAGIRGPGPRARPAHDAAARRQLGRLRGAHPGALAWLWPVRARPGGAGGTGVRVHRGDGVRRRFDAQARRGHQ